jgi:hypothetical protein
MAAIVEMRYAGSVEKLKLHLSELEAGFSTRARKKRSGYPCSSLRAAPIGTDGRLVPARATVAM